MEPRNRFVARLFRTSHHGLIPRRQAASCPVRPNAPVLQRPADQPLARGRRHLPERALPPPPPAPLHRPASSPLPKVSKMPGPCGSHAGLPFGEITASVFCCIATRRPSLSPIRTHQIEVFLERRTGVSRPLSSSQTTLRAPPLSGRPPPPNGSTGPTVRAERFPFLTTPNITWKWKSRVCAMISQRRSMHLLDQLLERQNPDAPLRQVEAGGACRPSVRRVPPRGVARMCHRTDRCTRISTTVFSPVRWRTRPIQTHPRPFLRPQRRPRVRP
jgi:hypothetical protein